MCDFGVRNEQHSLRPVSPTPPHLRRQIPQRERRETEGFMTEKCAICGCELSRTKDTYACPTPEGRSHASKHHYIPERFFGRSNNRRGTQREKIFATCPWDAEKAKTVLCYDCHEELIHNPVLLPDDIESLSKLVKLRGLSEDKKTDSRESIAGRIKLFHEIIRAGLDQMLKSKNEAKP